MSNSKKLKRKHSLVLSIGMVVGIALMGIAAYVIPEAYDGWRWIALLAGFVTSAACLGIARTLFRCPFCGQGYISPLALKGAKCRHCKAMIEWE